MISPRTLFLAFATVLSKSSEDDSPAFTHEVPELESSDDDYFSESASSGTSDSGTPPTPNATVRQRHQPSLSTAVPQTLSPQVRKVSIQELRAANTSGKAWVAVRGKVYDLTQFAARHPGGRDIILMGAGKDITPLFETSHGPKEKRTLQKFLVGTLVGKDMPGFPPADEFATALKARVSAHFADRKIDPKHSPLSYVRYALNAALLVAVFCLQWSEWAVASTWVFYGAAVVYGLLQTQYAASAVHDGSHGAIGHNPRVWRILVAGHDFFNGSSGTLWIYQHVLGHHPYTNIEDCDTDINTSEVDFRRIKHSQKWLWFYKLQPIYAPMLYVLLGTSVRTEDIMNGFVYRKRGAMTVNPFTPLQLAIFWGGKAFFFATRILGPLLYTSVAKRHIFAAFFVSDFVFSVVLAIIFQASHVVEEVAWPLPNPETGDIDGDWMRLQVETAQDYAHAQPITSFFVGCLNYQVVHHLFPHVAQAHLPKIAPIVVELTKQYNVKYEIKDTLYNAIGGHFGLLRLMGEPPHSH